MPFVVTQFFVCVGGGGGAGPIAPLGNTTDWIVVCVEIDMVVQKWGDPIPISMVELRTLSSICGRIGNPNPISIVELAILSPHLW